MTMTDTERPQVEFDPKRFEYIEAAWRHEDGSITYVTIDPCSGDVNPRKDYSQFATLVQRNSSCIDLEDDDEGLADAYDKWAHRSTGDTHMARYLSIFRPEILHYEEWSAGDSFGFGYVTFDNWRKAYLPEPGKPMTEDQILLFLDTAQQREQAKSILEGEVKEFRLWATGEVYMAEHVTVGDPIVEYGDHGAYVTGYKTTFEAAHGMIGYDEPGDITGEFTASPIVETLA